MVANGIFIPLIAENVPNRRITAGSFIQMTWCFQSLNHSVAGLPEYLSVGEC
jgi:hypothetical protein